MLVVTNAVIYALPLLPVAFWWNELKLTHVLSPI